MGYCWQVYCYDIIGEVGYEIDVCELYDGCYYVDFGQFWWYCRVVY